MKAPLNTPLNTPLKNKYIVGLTGGIGSGKTTIANLFIDKGIDAIDADEVAREVVLPGSPALVEIEKQFGSNFINKDGTLHRAKLREKVFSDDHAKQWLNELLHPAIRTRMLEQLAATTSDYCLLIAPLLLENKLDQYVDTVLVIDVDEETQVSRTKSRDGSDIDTIKSIIASQISRHERLKRADIIIDNQTQKTSDVEQQISMLDKQFMTQARIKLKPA